MFLILIVKKKHSHPIDRIRNQLPCSLPKMVVGGVIYRSGYNDRMKSFHSLKHTYNARLRVAGVPEEDRDFLTGHKGRMSMTTYYSAPELKKMLEYSNRVCQQNDNLVLLKHRVG